MGLPRLCRRRPYGLPTWRVDAVGRQRLGHRAGFADADGSVAGRKDRTRKSAFRQVPVTPLLRTVMAEWLAPAKHPGGQHTFCDTDGKPLTTKEALYWFEAAIANSKWKVLRGWHVFRHSFVSCMAMKGADQRFINGAVGHQTDDMHRRYRHLFPHKQHEVLTAVFGDGA